MPLEAHPVDDRGSFAWIANPAESFLRASAALAVDGGCVVVDPVDAPDLDGSLAPIGPVLAVVTLFQRHTRDAAALAARHSVPRVLPWALGGAGVSLPGIEERTVARRPGWHEALLWLPDRRLLACMETLATSEFFLARAGDRLGIHPFARLLPLRSAFDGIAPAAIVVGHGRPLTADASSALLTALSHPKRDLPRAWLRAAKLVRATRDSS